MPDDWQIEFHSGIPVYRQIINLITTRIAQGELKESEPIPTIRALADRLQINPNTVAKAYRELELKGIIEGRRGGGSFVSENARLLKLTAGQRQAKLRELYRKMIAEAKAYNLSEKNVRDYISGLKAQWPTNETG